MKRMTCIFGVVCILATSLPGWSQNVEQTIQTMVEQAVVLFKEKGDQEALKAINDPNGPFIKGELYVFALNMKNVVIAQPYERKLRGLSIDNVKDGNGEYCFKKFREIAHDPGSGWVSYTWAKPGQAEAVPKRAFIKKVPDEDIYVGAGYYLR
jgi:cytochrome c